MLASLVEVTCYNQSNGIKSTYYTKIYLTKLLSHLYNAVDLSTLCLYMEKLSHLLYVSVDTANKLLRSLLKS